MRVREGRSPSRTRGTSPALLRMGRQPVDAHRPLPALQPPAARSRSGTASDSSRVDTQPNEVTVALRKRRLAGHDRECHVEGIDVVQLALDDEGRRLGDRRDERIDVRRALTCRPPPWIRDRPRRPFRGGPPNGARTAVLTPAPPFEMGEQVGLGLLGVPIRPGHLVEQTADRTANASPSRRRRPCGRRPVRSPGAWKPRSTELFAGHHRCVTTLPRV